MAMALDPYVVLGIEVVGGLFPCAPTHFILLVT